MESHLSKIYGYEIGYSNKEEFNILKNEIFSKEIYKTNISKKNPLIIDVGSHIGLSILYFKQQYPDSRILAFEPNPNVFPLLEENIIYNKIKEVSLHNIALGNKASLRNFYIDNSGLDCFSTGSFTKDSWEGTQSTTQIMVKVEPLSKYINEEVDILKMDVEGAETEIIKELDKAGKLKYIKTIIIEFHPIKNRKYKNITSILEKNGFKVKVKQDPLGSQLVDILGENMSKESV